MPEGDEMAYQALTDGISGLDEQAKFIVVEFDMVGINAWKISRDVNGTPVAIGYSLGLCTPADDPGEFYRLHLRRLAQGAGRVQVMVRSPATADAGLLRTLRAEHPGLPQPVSCSGPVTKILTEVISDTPLTRKYELVVLRETRSGLIETDVVQIFPKYAQRGDSRQLRLRLEPSGDGRTVFAVVSVRASEYDEEYQQVSLQSASLPAGIFDVTAELVRPGRVRFSGLPRKLQPDDRDWISLLDGIPARIDRSPAAHLICVVEICGTEERVRNRIDRVQQLITSAADADGRLWVSVITYGVHAFEPLAPDEPATMQVHYASAREAAAALDRFRSRAVPRGIRPDRAYQRAAQLECALRLASTDLVDRARPPTLVIAGTRRPHPSAIDMTRILTCPHRRDWWQELQQLRYEFPGMPVGVIHDVDTELEFWSRLGATTLAPVEVADMEQVAHTLGLLRPRQNVPFPLAVTERG